MVYILPNLDLNFINIGEVGYANFSIYTTTEERIKHIIANERCRSIFSKKEIVGLFGRMKMQMVTVKMITPKVWDKILTWTEDGRWFVLEFLSFDGIKRKSNGTLPLQMFDLPSPINIPKYKHHVKKPWCGIKPILKHEPKTI